MTSHLNIIAFNKVAPILKDYIEHPGDMGCLGLMGEPGVGKTSIYRQVVRDCGFSGNYFNAGMMTLGELSGCAAPNKEFTHTVMLPLAHFDPTQPSMVDELTNSPDRSVFTGLSNFLVEGVIPGHPHVYNQARIYACNPPGCSELAEDLPRIILNRGDLFLVDYEHTDFLNYAFNEGIKKIHPVVAAFIQETKENYLHVKEFTPRKLYGVELPAPNTPFPSARAFELLSKGLYRMERGVPTTVFE